MNAERDALLKQVTMLDFTVIDLQLFLNTHPNDKEAWNMFHASAKNAAAAREKFESQFGPLTAAAATESQPWIPEPWPWQVDFNFSLAEGGR